AKGNATKTKAVIVVVPANNQEVGELILNIDLGEFLRVLMGFLSKMILSALLKGSDRLPRP
ncbi:MAG TPA: hypothetical protein DDW56_23835, partial [Cyanobacteria bacterium UBA11366]|nr:hypothetical protein [Cyanobacteria bacterium UBA11366]